MKKEVVRTLKPTSYHPKQSVTHIQFNATNDLMGVSTNDGELNIYPMADLIAGGASTASVTQELMHISS